MTPDTAPNGDQDRVTTTAARLTVMQAHLAADCPDRATCWAKDIHDAHNPAQQRTGDSEMGYINVQVGGSFVGQFGIKSTTEQFSAMDHGHADAVARAIEYLSAVVLPRATALDHKLQAEGAHPASGFTPKRILTDG